MMCRDHYVVGLFVLYIGICQAARSGNWGNEWQGSSRDFEFDDRVGIYRDGSADGPREKYVWGDADDDYSGWDSDDENSGDSLSIEVGRMTECQKREVVMLEKQRKGLEYDYVPKCTERGVFEAMQCDQKGNCFCVNYNGQEIPGTRRGPTRNPNCSGLDRHQVYTTDLIDVDGTGDKNPIVKTDDNGVETGIPKDDVIPIDGTEPDRPGSDENENDVFKTPSEQTDRPDFLSQPLILAVDDVTGTRAPVSVTRQPPPFKSSSASPNVEFITVNFTQEQMKTPPNRRRPSDVFVEKSHRDDVKTSVVFSTPGVLAGIIAFAVVCLLCAVLLVMFIVYRMRKKDEGSYALDEPKRSPSHPYQRAPTKEYFA